MFLYFSQTRSRSDGDLRPKPKSCESPPAYVILEYYCLNFHVIVVLCFSHSTCDESENLEENRPSEQVSSNITMNRPLIKHMKKKCAALTPAVSPLQVFPVQTALGCVQAPGRVGQESAALRDQGTTT